jgi:hypothetical protein
MRSRDHYNRKPACASEAPGLAFPITDLGEVADCLRSGREHHVCFLIGSAVSSGGPANCLGVDSIRRTLVLQPLYEAALARADSGDGADRAVAKREARLLERSLIGYRELSRAIQSLPFEQFMGCLDLASPEAAASIVDLGVGQGELRRPNVNHEAVADIIRWWAVRGSPGTVTILTTNYDTLLEIALETRLRRKLRPVAGMPCPCFEMDVEGTPVRLAKLHGTILDRHSLVFAFSQVASLTFGRNYGPRRHGPRLGA